MNLDILNNYHILDIVSFFLISIYTLSGFYFGFVRTLFDNLVFFVSLILLTLMYPYCKNFLRLYIESDFMLFLFNLILLYIVFVIFNVMTKSAMKPVIDNFRLGFMNNFLGACIGFTKGCILLLVAFTIFVIFYFNLYKTEYIKDKISCLDEKSYPVILKEAQVFSLLDFYMKGLIIYVPDYIIEKIKNLDFFSKNEK
ncbi:MAG: CvpA family protein [Rickettsia sp.]|nr:CvpA family protein [Rickettsia sp.]